MLRILSLTSVALAAASTVSGFIVPRREPPPGWNFDILEPYQTYHTRYIALDCQDKHGQAFFDQCCHPLLAIQKLADRPAQCIPSPAASSSAALVEPTSTVPTPADADDDDGDDGDCDDDDDEPTATPAPKPTSTPAPKPSSTSVKASPSPVAPVGNVEAPPPPPPASIKPTESSKPAPEPHTTAKATPSSKAPAPAPTSPANSGSSVLQKFTDGFATFFFQNRVAGACGKVHSDDDLIAAIDQERYGNSGNESKLCGQKVQITNQKNGKSVTVTIADDCPTCKNSNSIDLSHAAFVAIAPEADGMVPITWNFLN